MNRTLIRKELRALQPFIFLLGFLVIVDVVFLFFTEFPDAYGIPDWSDGYGLSDYCIINFIIAFALAQGLLMRERAEDTLEFLDALPITRRQVFWSKFAAAYLVLAAMVIIDIVLYFLLHVWSRESHTPAIYPEFWGPRLVILLWMNFVYLCIGLAASLLGRFGLIAVACGLLWVFILRIRGEPVADLIDPFAVGELTLDGSRVVLPWRLLFNQLAIGLGCLWLAYIGFMRLSMPRSSGGLWRRAAFPFFVVTVVGLAVAWIALMVAFSPDDGGGAPVASSDEVEPIYPSWNSTRARTDDFVFIYPDNLAGKSEQLIGDSGRVHDTILDFLGAERRSDLVVDLTSTSPRHAGTAYWKRVRMNLNAGDTPQELAAILGHELTHVYIDQMSDNRVADRFNSTRFFHEGLASYLEYRYFREPEALNDIRRLAAAAHDREEVRFETLVDSSALASRYTSEWVYPLGEAFVAAVIERFGEEAPQKLIRAFAREDAPKGLRSMTLWQDTFQACGYNLEEAIAAFYTLLEREANETQREWLDSLPRLRGEVVSDEDRVGVRIVRHQEGPADKAEPLEHRRLLCRFRPTATTADNEYRVSRADEDGVAWVDRGFFQRGGFWYQIGYSEDDLMMPVFGPWVRGQLPR